MGLEFIRDQKKKYQQRLDASATTYDTRDLLERGKTDRVTEQYNVRLNQPGIKIVPGYRLLLRFTSDTTAIVTQGSKVIGELLPEAAASLADKIKAAGKTSGMLTVLANSEPDIADVFQIKVVDGKDTRPK
jgi:hypothetical protein